MLYPPCFFASNDNAERNQLRKRENHKKKGYYTDTVETKPAKILIRHAIKNNGKKTITACYFRVKIQYSALGVFSDTLYEDNFFWPECKIRPGKSQAETRPKEYKESEKNHELIKKGLTESISKVTYKVFFIKYSDGTSEGFNLDL